MEKDILFFSKNCAQRNTEWKLKIGNNTTISLECDSKADADRIYSVLSQGSTESVAPHDEFWGYWGVCLDRFGIRWMFNITNQTQGK